MNKIEWEGSDTQKWKHARASLSMLGNLAFFILSSAVFFSKSAFSKKKPSRNTIRVPHSLDPDQARPFVGPDLNTNC